jgi:hypothetical protein
VAAAAALVLTAGSVNAYLSGAGEMLRELTAVPGQIGPNGVLARRGKHVANIFDKLGLAPSDSDNRRVIAAIRYLESWHGNARLVLSVRG